MLVLHRSRNLLPEESASARYTLKARGAICQYLQSVRAPGRDEVLLPAFHCPTLVYAVLAAGCKVRYYGVRENLALVDGEIEAMLAPRTAAVVVVNFFGFTTPIAGLRQHVNDAGAKLIEDCAHSFLFADPLRLAGGRGDATVFALWKLVPAGAGGLIVLDEGEAGLPPPHHRPRVDTVVRITKRLAEEAVESMRDGHVRRALLALEGRRVARKVPAGAATPGLRRLEDVDLETRYPFVDEHFSARLPWINRQILTKAELDEVAQARRWNYTLLAAELEDCRGIVPLFPELPQETVPWCFPLLMNDRGRFDVRMRELGVPLFTFGETLHPSLFDQSGPGDESLDVACRVRDRITCIGIHQKLSVDDIRYSAAMIRKVLS